MSKRRAVNANSGLILPIRLARNKGVSPQNIRQIEGIIFEHRDFLGDKFYDYFSHEK
jgi:hypothetical protein